jgi:Holliday junction DNA helicase RuvA
MIGYIEGEIVERQINKILIKTGGLGFIVYTTPENSTKLSNSKTAKMWTHMVIREDAFELYGFQDVKELNFFKSLINISGIGPKTALGVISASSIDYLKSAIARGDISYLTKISGIGKKIAEKIIFELKEKLSLEIGQQNKSEGDDVDVLEALLSLGYKEKEAREALQKLPKDTQNESEKIKIALKILGSKK